MPTLSFAPRRLEAALRLAGLVRADNRAANLKTALSNFLFRLERGKATVHVTNLDSGMAVSVQEVEGDFDGVCLPLVAVQAVLSELPDDRVVLECDGPTATLRGSSFEYEFMTSDVGNFPEFPSPPLKQILSVKAADLTRLIASTCNCAAKAHGTYSAMSGVCFELDPPNEKLILIGTDSKRLAAAEAPAGGFDGFLATNANSYVLPVLTCRAAAAVAGLDPDVQVTIRFDPKTGVYFETPTAQLYSRLMDGRYPPWRKVLPTDLAKSLTISPPDWLAAARSAMVMVGSESKHLVFDIGRGKALVTASDDKKSRSKVEISIGDPLLKAKFALPVEGLLDYLKIADGLADEVVLKFESPSNPFLFESPGLTYLLMPIELADEPAAKASDRPAKQKAAV